MSTENPLIQVRDAIWTMLEANTAFTTYVPEGFRIKPIGSGVGDLDKAIHAGGHSPIVEVMILNSEPFPDCDSTCWNWKVTWGIVAYSGKQRTNMLFELMWAIYRAMKGWDTYLATLTWGSDAFVKNAEPISTKEAEGKARGPKEWTTLWACVTDLYFTRTAI